MSTRPAATSTRQQRSPIQQLTLLLTTQQFYWFLGHVFGVLFFLVSTVTSFFRPATSLRYYQFSLLSIIITYVIVIKQVYFKGAKKTTIGVRLLRDENVQYLLLAAVFYVTSFKVGVITASLYSYVIFSVFHIVNYFQNHLLTIALPTIHAQQRLNTILTQFTSRFNQPALYFASSSEMVLLVTSVFSLVPAYLYHLLFKFDIIYAITRTIIFLSVVVFNKFRFESNQFTKDVVSQYDAKVLQALATNASALQTYQRFKSGLLQYLNKIQLPKEQPAKKN
ncbi:Pore and endoplasmic reticulum protein of 33 kDa [Spathaspora sp. JA1]|nr:Pore and endoplasmic reticulum protein of 33 kDa [Spathaspora sp. JA1]